MEVCSSRQEGERQKDLCGSCHPQARLPPAMRLNKRLLRTALYALLALLLAAATLSVLSRPGTSSSPAHTSGRAGKTSKGLFSDMLNLPGTDSVQEIEDPLVLVAVGFVTCTAFAFFESCSDDIGKVYKRLSSVTDDYSVIQTTRVHKFRKDLRSGRSTFTTIHPYEVRVPYDLVSKYSIPAIDSFFVHNALDDTLLKNTRIPTPILEATKNTTNIKLLNSMGYYDAGYGLWYRTSPSHSTLYHQVNFLFNAHLGDTLPGWSAVSKRPLTISKNDAYSLGADRNISDFRTFNYHKFDNEVYVYVKEKKPVYIPQVSLKTHKDGKFKIVQLADLHLTTGFGKCLDPYPKLDYPLKNCLADEFTLDFVHKVLDLENPDLVVLTGDQLFGPETFDSETALLKLLGILIQRKIPYALVFGNHDTEGGTLRPGMMMHMIENLPYSVSSSVPGRVGLGNYEVVIDGVGSNPPIVLYMLDSSQPGEKGGYKAFTDEQKHFVERLSSYHEDHKDPIKLAFFHIPLPEYTNVVNVDAANRQGNILEGVVPSSPNTGMFDTLKSLNVRLISVGHDHCNDFCFNNDGVTLCYGGGTGLGGYGGYGGYIRRIRVFEIDTNSKEIITWKRLYNDPETKVDLYSYT